MQVEEIKDEAVEKDEGVETVEIDNSDDIRNMLNNNNLSSRVAGGASAYIGRKRAMVGMDGDIYLNNKFSKASVLTPDNKIAFIKARYRVFDDQIEILQKEEELILFKDKVKAISIDGQVFVPRLEYNKEGESKLAWFELLSEGSVNLYQQYSIRIKRSDYNPSLNTGNKNDEMLTEKAFYYSLSTGSKSMKKLKKGRSNILDALKKRKNAVNEFARENSLRWSKQEDLVKLFNFYNSKDKK
jgi:hypothetical protein